MKFIIEFLRAYDTFINRWFSDNRQREEIIGQCGEYYMAILKGLYPELSQYMYDLIQDRLHDYADSNISAEVCKKALLEEFKLEDREDLVEEVREEWCDVSDVSRWLEDRTWKRLSPRHNIESME